MTTPSAPYIGHFADRNKQVTRFIEYLTCITETVTPSETRQRILALTAYFAKRFELRDALVKLQMRHGLSHGQANAAINDSVYKSLHDYLIAVMTDRVNSIGDGVFSRHSSISRYVLDVFMSHFTVDDVPRLKLTLTIRPFTAEMQLSPMTNTDLKTICTTVVKYVLPRDSIVEALPYNFVKKELA